MSVEHEDEELSGGEGVVRDDKVGKNMFGCWHVILDKPRSMEKGLRSLDFFLFLFSFLAWLHRYTRSSIFVGNHNSSSYEAGRRYMCRLNTMVSDLVSY